jgi:hypothetical protein
LDLWKNVCFVFYGLIHVCGDAYGGLVDLWKNVFDGLRHVCEDTYRGLVRLGCSDTEQWCVAARQHRVTCAEMYEECVQRRQDTLNWWILCCKMAIVMIFVRRGHSGVEKFGILGL